MAPKQLEEIESLMDQAILSQEHSKIKRAKHGFGRPSESAVKLKAVAEVMDEESSLS